MRGEVFRRTLGTLAMVAALLAHPAAGHGAKKKAPHAPPAPPTSAVPPAVAAMSWREVVPHEPALEEVETIYRSLFMAHCATPPTPEDPDWQSKLRESSDFRYRYSCSHFVSFDGSLAGIWDFKPPQGQESWPSLARHVEFPKDVSSYKARITVYCRAADAACSDYTSEARAMRPPNPLPFFGKDSPQGLGWAELIGNEPCEPGTPHMEAPEYPREALSYGIAGTVSLVILTNSCGEVRNVSVSKNTSHDRQLEKAALNSARGWRLDLSQAPSTNEHYHWVLVPVEFQQ